MQEGFFTWLIHICLRSFQKPKLLLGVCSLKWAKKKPASAFLNEFVFKRIILVIG